MKILLVEWYDTASGIAWTDLPSAKKRHTESVISIGILINSNRREMVILPNLSKSGAVFHEVAIPKGCIKRVRQLKISR